MKEPLFSQVYNVIPASQSNYTQFMVEHGCRTMEAGSGSQAVTPVASLSPALTCQSCFPFALQDLAQCPTHNRDSLNICYMKG